MKIIIVRLIILTLLVNLVCFSVNAEENTYFRDFIRAIERKDRAAMQSIVREHQRNMAIMFFVALKQSAHELNDSTMENKGIEKNAGLLLLCIEIARTFDVVYPGQDLLYKQFKDSRPLLTSNARREIVSDESLGRFINACVLQIVVKNNRRTVATDLESIITAATESSEDRLLRVKKEAQERLRVEAAERVRRERLAKITAKFHQLLEARDEHGMIAMLMDAKPWVSNPELRRVAAEILANMGDPRAIGVMVVMLDDETVAAVAMTGLRRIGQSAFPALVERLQRFSPTGGMKRAAQTLQSLSYHPKTAKERALLALAQDHLLDTVFSGPYGFSVAVTALHTDGWSIRWTAIQVLSISLGLPVVFLIGMVLYLRRKWLFPSLKICLKPSECRQYSKAIKSSTRDDNTEPGMILQTLWAENRFKRRQRIKVETLVSDECWEIAGQDEQSFVNIKAPIKDPKRREDVLVTVGRSVKKGTYLARGHNLSIRIRVSSNPA